MFTHSIPHRQRIASAVVGMLVGTGPGALAQDVRWKVFTDNRDEQLGEAIEWLDDLDGDGFAEVAYRSRNMKIYGDGDSTNPHEDERIEIVSGADFSPLRTIALTRGTEFGIDFALGGDYDQDGACELLVVWLPEDSTEGHIAAISMRDGSWLREYTISGVADCRFAAMDALPDSDGDGLPELLVGLPLSDNGDGTWGLLRVMGSADGAVLAEWRAAEGHWDGGSSNFGRNGSFQSIPDADLDGLRDLVTAERLDVGSGKHHFEVTIRSGASYSEIVGTTIIKTDLHYLGAILGVDDMNADERGDVVLVLNVRSSTQNVLLELSGLDLSQFRSASTDWGSIDHGVSVGDLDRDGRGDYCLSGFDRQVSEPCYVLYVLGGRSGKTMSSFRRIADEFEIDEAIGVRLPNGPARDLDGDHKVEILYGEPRYWADSRRVAALSTVSDVDIRERVADTELHKVEELHFTSDLDGDGVNDFLAREWTRVDYFNHEHIVARSGVDGAVLRDFDFTSDVRTPMTGEVVSLPDLDGDSIADYSIVARHASGLRATTRSGLDDHLLHIVQISTDSLDTRVEATGCAENSTNVATLFACSPSRTGDKAGEFNLGRVTAIDLANGVVRWSASGRVVYARFGEACVPLPDLDGDGLREVAIGIPGHFESWPTDRYGRVEIRSGMDGHVLHFADPPAGGQEFGVTLSCVQDLDGDAIHDLATSYSTKPGPILEHSLMVASSMTGEEIWRTSGAHSNILNLITLEDVNRDGSDEIFVTEGWSPPTASATSSADGTILGDALPDAVTIFGFRMTTAPDWLPSDHYDKLGFAAAIRNGICEGAAVVSFPELWLTLTPETAPTDSLVLAELRGGAPFALMGVMIVAIDDIPFGQFGVLDVFDGSGAWMDQDTAPSELAGTTLSLQAYAVGFDSRMARSSVRTLRFE